ncbi:MAG: AAA family ATPase [Planctomycetes bacterium]|nr:AAA family ATPase [Planctomycetota bacterium]
MQDESSTAVAEKQAEHADLFKLFAGAIQEHLENLGIDPAEVSRICDEKIAAARLPRPLEVHLADQRVVALSDRTHRQFEELLGMVREGHRNLLMVGPAGTGKTTLAKHVAKALDLDFAFLSLSAGVTETHLFGRILPQADGSWGYQTSRFIEVYENGGVFLLDEIDAADSNVMVAINAALANGVLANPVNGKLHQRHADCYIIAAANTYGLGGDTMYVGRNQLDAATLDRFVMATLFVDYDTGLENDIVRAVLAQPEGDELLAWVTGLRESIRQNRIRRVASTRLIEGSVKAMNRGASLDDVKGRYFQSWTADERAKVGA